VRKTIFQFADEFLGFRELGRECFSYVSNSSSSAQTSNNDLSIHVLFEQKEHALRFHSAVRNLPSKPFTTAYKIQLENCICVPALNSSLGNRIFAYEYQSDGESPPATSILGAVTTYDYTDDVFNYQKIEKYSIFGGVLKAVGCHLMSHEYIKNNKLLYGNYDKDPNNRLALSSILHDMFDGRNCIPTSCPQFNLKIKEILNEKVDGRFPVILIVEAYNAQAMNLLERYLEVIGGEGLEREVKVFIKDTTIFKTCLDWKYQQTIVVWEKVSDL